MRVPSAEHHAQIAGEFLHAQRAQHHFGMGTRQRDDAAHAEEVRRDEHVGVQHMAVQNLAVEDQLAQQLGLLGQLHAQRRFQRLQRRHLVAHRADAADARGDVRHFRVRPPAQHRLEEARRLDDLQFAAFQLAVLGIDDDVAVAFDAGDVVNVNLDFAHMFSPLKADDNPPYRPLDSHRDFVPSSESDGRLAFSACASRCIN